MPHRLYPLVAARASHRCEYCRAPELLFNSSFEVEHIRPLAHGGTDDDWNLALACRACNGAKHTAMIARDPESGRAVRLFNPRSDIWHDHFDVDTDTAEIAGRTAIGRATVSRLQLNALKHVEARWVWIAQFGFPDDLPEGW
jgi:hypothetical protein